MSKKTLNKTNLETLSAEQLAGCCQTKANQSHFSSNLNPLGYAKTAPLGKSGGAVQLEI
jgi:hypothetical protein